MPLQGELCVYFQSPLYIAQWVYERPARIPPPFNSLDSVPTVSSINDVERRADYGVNSLSSMCTDYVR